MALEYGLTTLLKYVNANAVTSISGLMPAGSFVRLQAHDKDIEKPQGTYTWGPLDAAVDLFYSAGFKIVLTIEGMANWFLDPTCGLPTAIGIGCDAINSQIASWGWQLINRYKSKIVGVEMGNEEFAFVTGSCRAATIYAGIIAQCYPYLKSLLGSAQTVGCFGYTNYSGNTGDDGDPNYWFNALFAANSGVAYMDYANFHYYNGGNDPAVGKSGGAPPLSTVCSAIYDAAVSNSLRSLPIRCTEFGWQGKPTSGNTTCPNNIGASLQGTYTTEAFGELAAATNVTHGFLYTDGAAEAGFYDCHDLDGLSSYDVVKNYLAGYTPPAANATVYRMWVK